MAPQITHCRMTAAFSRRGPFSPSLLDDEVRHVPIHHAPSRVETVPHPLEGPPTAQKACRAVRRSHDFRALRVAHSRSRLVEPQNMRGRRQKWKLEMLASARARASAALDTRRPVASRCTASSTRADDQSTHRGVQRVRISSRSASAACPAPQKSRSSARREEMSIETSGSAMQWRARSALVARRAREIVFAPLSQYLFVLRPVACRSVSYVLSGLGE
jgi:hypothetical protein